MTAITNTEADEGIHPGSIVVAVDGSTHADHALAWAAEAAQLQQRPLAVVHVEKAIGSRERGWLAQAGIPLSQVTEEIRDRSEKVTHLALGLAIAAAPGIEIDTVRRIGDPRAVLIQLAAQASMIVLGSRGRGPVSSRLLGSVSIAVSRHAPCPVVVVRPREDVARLRGVLVATDGSDRSLPTLEAAFREASFRALPLTVLHCVWEALSAYGGWRGAGPDDPFWDPARIRVAELLTGLRDKFPDVVVNRGIFAGHVDQCVADMSRAHELTVIGRHAHTLLERVGSYSLTTAIIEHACGPVLIVP
jgi:nucleotide-binding universal stress UspA family protein